MFLAAEDQQGEPRVARLRINFSQQKITLGGLNWRLSLPGGGLNIWLRSASGGGDPPKDPGGGIMGGGTRTGGGATLGGGAD